MTTPVQQQPQTLEDYARRTAVATEKLAKVAVGWSVALVVLLAIGLLVYLQATQGPTPMP